MTTSSFGTVADRYYSELNPDICKFYSAGQTFEIAEEREEGKADIACTTTCACLHISRIDKYCFSVLSGRKCADHLVFLYDASKGTWHLHIFELTKSVSNSVWSTKILPQFRGGLANAYAIAGVLHINGFDRIAVHCGYRTDKTKLRLLNCERRWDRLHQVIG